MRLPCLLAVLFCLILAAGSSARATIYFHVESFTGTGGLPLLGSKSLWCGGQQCPTCPAGYGNNWAQVFMMKQPLSVTGNVYLGFITSYGTEAGNDRLWIDYSVTPGTWINLSAIEGYATYQTVSEVLPAAAHSGSVRWRFRFISDAAGSDWDELIAHRVGVVIDSLSVRCDGAGGLAVEDFEGEAQGQTGSSDWIAMEGTPGGTDVVTSPIDETTNNTTPVQVTFENVTGGGVTSLATSPTGPMLPGAFTLGNGLYYHISTTATYSGSITVCIEYDENTLVVPEATLQMLHYDQAIPGWVNSTTAHDQANNIICGVVSSLSPFAIGAGSLTGAQPIRQTTYALHECVPNPFNPFTTVAYDIPAEGGSVTIAVFDLSGRLVRTLFDGVASPGQNTVSWDGTDQDGHPVASGVYFCRMSAAGFGQSRRLVLLK